jgi:hypothetical protein
MAAFKLQIPQHRELTGGDLLAQSLLQLGVKVAFGLQYVTGEQNISY